MDDFYFHPTPIETNNVIYGYTSMSVFLGNSESITMTILNRFKERIPKESLFTACVKILTLFVCIQFD